MPLATIAAIVAPKFVPTPGLIERTAQGWPTRAELSRLGTRVLILIAGTRLVGGLAWAGAMQTRIVTIELVAIVEAASIVAYLILVGRVIDHVFGPTPWRIVAGVLAAPVLFLLYGAAMPTDYVKHPEPEAADAAPANANGEEDRTAELWYEAALARLAKLPPNDPVIFVAASGGGSRAAIFAGLVLETMALPPNEVVLPLDGQTAFTPSWKSPLADSIFAISSVSGGSVAAAQYVASVSDVKATDEPDAATSLMWPSVLAVDTWELQHGAPVGMARGVLKRDGVLPQLLVNFNAVAVRGFLSAFDTRGRSLADFWEHHFHWTNRITKASPGQTPLLLINATLVESGRGLVLGFPTVPQALFDEGSRHGVLQLAPAQADRITRVSLERLDGEGDVRVGDAVRLSASFPFGMDSARLDDLDRLPPADGSHATAGELAAADRTGVDHLHISDGGVLDNTGTGTIRELLSGLLEAADQGSDGALAVVAEFKRRGVLVVEIDSGAKPITNQGGVLAQMFGPVTQSSTVLAQAAYTAEREAVFLRRSALERTGLDVYWATFSYCPRSDGEEVMTAWGLGPSDQMNLIDQYFGNTLTGNCARRDIPVTKKKTREAGNEGDPASPLAAVSAAFQDSVAEQPAEALQFAGKTPNAQDPVIQRLLLTAIDEAALKGRVDLATDAAASLGGDVTANDAVTLSMIGPSAALGTAGRVHTIDEDKARAGWFLAARYTEGAEGAKPTLDWSVLWEDSSDGLGRYKDRQVALARPVFVHRAAEKDRFAPGRVIAVADRHARVTIEDLKVESTGGRQSVYAYATWGEAVSQPMPCTDLSYTIQHCPGNEARADELRAHLADNGHIRGACLKMVDAPRVGTEKGDAIVAVEALSGDAKAIQAWAEAAFKRTVAFRRELPAGETGIGARLCE